MRRYTATLIVATLSAYLLLVLGAMTAATDLRQFAAGHYAAAGIVWILVVGVTVRSWTGGHDRRVRIGSTLAFVVFPGQATLGAATRWGVTPIVDQAHLLGGMAVFGLLLGTLVWHLDGEVAAEVSRRSEAETVLAERREGDTSALDGRAGIGTAGNAKTATGSALGVDSPPTTSGLHTSVMFDIDTSFISDRVRAYVALTKPRLMWLLCLLALAGMALTTITGATLDGVTVVATLAGGTLAIGASGTFNHVYERDRDRQMARTSDRPLVSNSVDPLRASIFGAGLFVASMVVMVTLVNPLAAGLTAFAAFYYVIVYTVVLKPSTTWNTVLGGGAGALPAVIGWAAITGSVGRPALLLAAVVFCWTPAHFYNLAIAYSDEYDEAGYPMLPVIKGDAVARKRILFWLGATLLVAGGLGVVAGFSPMYAVISTVAGLVFVWTVAEQYSQRTDRAAYRSFHASNAYLGAILLAVVVETVVV